MTKKQPEQIQTEHLIYTFRAGRRYLKLLGPFPQLWRYSRESRANDFDLSEWRWVEDKDDATEIPAGQVEDFISWIHQFTGLTVDRTTRARAI